jgi:chorismate-pyruvate lyase
MKKLRQSWVNLDHVALHAVPQIWQDWLSDAGSLTQLISNKTKSSVSVEVLTTIKIFSKTKPCYLTSRSIIVEFVKCIYA